MRKILFSLTLFALILFSGCKALREYGDTNSNAMPDSLEYGAERQMRRPKTSPHRSMVQDNPYENIPFSQWGGTRVEKRR